jgi:hypothetical protein
MSGIYLGCCSVEKKVMDIGPTEGGAVFKCYKKCEGVILLILAVAFAALTASIAYGLIPTGSMNPMYFAGVGTALTILCFQIGLIQACFQHCLTVRNSADSSKI